MKTWNLSSESVTARFLQYVGMLRLAGKPVIVKITDGKCNDRQNPMIYAVYRQISDRSEDESVHDIRVCCKLDLGIPILAMDEDFYDYCAAIELIPISGYRLAIVVKNDVWIKSSALCTSTQ